LESGAPKLAEALKPIEQHFAAVGEGIRAMVGLAVMRAMIRRWDCRQGIGALNTLKESTGLARTRVAFYRNIHRKPATWRFYQSEYRKPFIVLYFLFALPFGVLCPVYPCFAFSLLNRRLPRRFFRALGTGWADRCESRFTGQQVELFSAF
jgi:hypothetical protein